MYEFKPNIIKISKAIFAGLFQVAEFWTNYVEKTGLKCGLFLYLINIIMCLYAVLVFIF